MPKRKTKPVEQDITQAFPTQDEEGNKLPQLSRLGRGRGLSKEAKEWNLTDKQLKFCQLYTNSNELRGNGVRAYALAFGINLAKPGQYNLAKVEACKLLAADNILKYINHIFENTGLNDTAVDNELLFTIRQNTDFGSKVAAIKVYNDLKGRIEKNQQKNAVNFQINIAPSANNTEVQINQIEGKGEEAA
jgi:hypothetical protein